MILIRNGDRGPAVEDVQRRLLRLGHDLGPTGVDGVFLGRTAEAVCAFQRELELSEDGVVGPVTWSALVDATFTLGDRMLYLRHPHLHGQDVASLQGALNALGFACGAPDGIFGAFTERAVREFQANCGLVPDGIAGAETFRALVGLRHVWEDKDPSAPARLVARSARSAGVLAGVGIDVLIQGESCREVGVRLSNVATAAEATSRVAVREGASAGEPVRLMLVLADADAVSEDSTSVPTVRFRDADQAFANRLVAALASQRSGPARVRVLLDARASCDEHVSQRTAVALLDALCVALS